MCTNCQDSNQSSSNWFSTSTYPCDPCETTPVVCKKSIPSLCVKYNGPALNNLGVGNGTSPTSTITLNDILVILDTLKQIQDLKNTNILAALNDINARLNVLESSTHPPYTLL